MAVLEHLERMSEERFLEIYSALAQQGYGPLDGELAKRLKFRPHAIRKLPMEKRAQRARSMILNARNAELAYEVFGSYLVKKDRAMITDFLDATGVEHEDGMIADVAEAKPDEAKVTAAVEALEAKYPREDVALYLAISAEHWPDAQAIQDAFHARSQGA